MSSAARTARTCASPTTPAATATARSARPCRQGMAGRPGSRAAAGPYFHVVFTLPAPIAAIAWQNKAVVYDLLFKAAAETLITIAADPKHLGARIGLTAVLHTWGSALTHHPHVHIIVPGGGISPDGERWIACRPGFFLPVRVLSRLFRRLFLEQLSAAHHAGQLQFFGNQAALADPKAFKDHLAPLRRAEWVVYAKRPFGGPEAVLAYLSRYTHRVAIANSRLVAFNDSGVTFKWKDYRAKQQRTGQADDTRRRRVHPPLPDPRAAQRVPPHPPLRPVRQWRPGREHRPRPSIAPCSRAAAATRRHRLCGWRRAPTIIVSLPVLRRAHDRHRDIRAWLHTAASAQRSASGSTAHDRRQTRATFPACSTSAVRSLVGPPPRLTHDHRLARSAAHARPPTWGANRFRMLVLPSRPLPTLAAPDFKQPTSHLSR